MSKNPCAKGDTLTEIQKRLLDAAQLLDDCLIRIYPEEFTKEHQEAAAKRFRKHNGTISRIADMADRLRRASNAQLDGQKEAAE